MAGQYVCAANNVEGSGYSNGLEISVNYKPVCTAPTIQKKDTGIGKKFIFKKIFNSFWQYSTGILY